MRKYPAFIIARSRRLEASRFSDDFVVCPDKEVGYIARVFKLPKSRREEFEIGLRNLTEEAIDNRYVFAVVGDVFVVLEVVKMLYEPVAHISRLRPLMKKAMKAYLYGEDCAVNRDGVAYDDQIAAVEEVIRLAESQESRLVDMNGEAGARAFTAALKAARDSIVLLQKIIKVS